jgi:cell division protein ZapA
VAQVTVNINKRDYQVACDDGEEEHLAKLGAAIDSRVKEITAVAGQIGDARLLVMVSLLLADELSDVCSELEEIRALETVITDDENFSVNIEEMAKRIENIAERIEQA